MADTLEALRARRDAAQFDLDRLVASTADRKAEVATLTKRITALLRSPAKAEELPLFDRAEVGGTAFGIDTPEPLGAPAPAEAEEVPSALDPLDGQIVGPSGEVEDIGMGTPGPAYTWHSYPVERLLPNRANLADDLVAEDLGTLGAIASWLSDGNTLEEVEIHQGEEEPHRLVRRDLVDLRAALLRTVYHLKIEEEFPPVWIDPEIGRTVRPIEPPAKKPAPKKKAKAKPVPDPEPADGLSLFAVRPRQKKAPIYFIKARSLLKANEYRKAQHPEDARHYCYLWEGPLPKNSVVLADPSN